jgi:hypothetical protein
VTWIASIAAAAILAVAPLPTHEVVSEGPFHVGDPISIRMSAPVGDDGLASFPSPGDTWGDAEILEVGPVETTVSESGDTHSARTVTVTFFESGEFTLPAPSLGSDSPAAENGGEQSETSALSIRVDSVLPESEELPPAKPSTPPRELGWGTSFTWTAIALALAGLAALFVVLRQRAAIAEGDGRKPTDPLEDLLREIQALLRENDPDRLFTALSLSVRHFLGRLLAFPAPESTTTEIRRRLATAELAPSTTTRMEKLLRRCDGVKFARETVSTAARREALEEAEVIAQEVARALAPSDGDELEEAG